MGYLAELWSNAQKSIFNTLIGRCNSLGFKFSAYVIDMGRGLKDVVSRATWKVFVFQNWLTVLKCRTSQ